MQVWFGKGPTLPNQTSKVAWLCPTQVRTYLSIKSVFQYWYKTSTWQLNQQLGDSENSWNTSVKIAGTNHSATDTYRPVRLVYFILAHLFPVIFSISSWELIVVWMYMKYIPVQKYLLMGQNWSNLMQHWMVTKKYILANFPRQYLASSPNFDLKFMYFFFQEFEFRMLYNSDALKGGNPPRQIYIRLFL